MLAWQGAGMTRDETVALFEACEAKRRDARAAALAGGKSEDEAQDIAHEAAKAHWNAWAEPLLAERKADGSGRPLGREKDFFGSLKPENAETRAWMEKAAADFSRCLFLLPGVDGTKETAGEDSKEDGSGALPVKSIQLEGDRADFSGFVFPGNASFESATFTGDARFETPPSPATPRSKAPPSPATPISKAPPSRARFEDATFPDYAHFTSATFTGHAEFNSATFTGYNSFESATFSGAAWFESATFAGDARFESATFSGDARFEAPPSPATPRSQAPPSPATPGSEAPPSPARPVRKRHLLRRRPVRKRHLLRHRPASIAPPSKTPRITGKQSFWKRRSFTGIKVDRAFDMTGAKFKQVPAFNQADFKQAPDLDDVRVSASALLAQRATRS